jgi:hypothetical protein
MPITTLAPLGAAYRLRSDLHNPGVQTGTNFPARRSVSDTAVVHPDLVRSRDDPSYEVRQLRELPSARRTLGVVRDTLRGMGPAPTRFHYGRVRAPNSEGEACAINTT